LLQVNRHSHKKKGGKMKKLLMIIPLVILLCFTFSCQAYKEKPAVDITADIEALKNMVDEWMALYNAGDFERLVSFYYAEDAVGMAANEPILEGREAILSDLKKGNKMYDSSQFDSSLAEDVRVFGNLAMVRGADTGINTPIGGGEPIKFNLKWVGIFERQPDGTWKCICEIVYDNNPLPAPSSEKE
jgi:ketosteroid isomerase-like protein